MSSEHEKPVVTPVGNLLDLVGQACTPREPTYQLGDFVWATGNPDGSGTRWLAHIESRHSVRASIGRRWLVRVRKRQFWTSGPIHMYIIAKLTPEEFTQERKLGRIPAAGERF